MRDPRTWWERLRHGGLLLDTKRLLALCPDEPPALSAHGAEELRRMVDGFEAGTLDRNGFVAGVLSRVCELDEGAWTRGNGVGREWSRVGLAGEVLRPQQLWLGPRRAVLPVFVDKEERLGVGNGRRVVSRSLQWLRAGHEHLAIVTNGHQWRLLFAGVDFDAWCEWDVALWFEDGRPSPQVDGLRTLLRQALWIPTAEGAPSALVQAIRDSRKGQADLSAALGERMREAVELLVQAHEEALAERCADIDPADIYRAAVRVVMRLVVVLFAESRDLLPRDNALYHRSYGLGGLLEELERASSRGAHRFTRSWTAWPRLMALFRLISQGSHHPSLPVPAYGGDLFAPGDSASPDGLSRALAVFEGACFDRELLPDRGVLRLLWGVTRTRVKVRQGRASTLVAAPVDFSDLSSEYIGILYEGLLDFELKTAPAGDPVIFLAIGKQPALPLSRLEDMNDSALANLLEKMKATSKGGESAEDGEESDGEEAEEAESEEGDEADAEDTDDEAYTDEAVADQGETGDQRHAVRERAERWARRAAEVGKLVSRPRGTLTAERRHAYADAISRKASQLVPRVALPGERYLVRWGGTRKGSGTFYTRPGLAVPTVHRTLRPLVYDPPLGPDGAADRDAPPPAWTPKKPEEILALKVCDPACGSGTFPVAILRYLTDALFVSLHHHGRITAEGDRAVVRLLRVSSPGNATPDERLADEMLPCRPDDPAFETQLKARLRRHVVERCVYGVDLDPLAVELCRLALWIETMDRSLPFSFLDHKVKCGNSLVGAWFDQFQHYPVMAWKNRKSGDEKHTNGVHFEKEARAKAIKGFVEDRLTPDLRGFLQGRTLFEPDLLERATLVHDEALATLTNLHALPVHESDERARIYREEIVGSPTWRSLKVAMDMWCASWFWPADELTHAPLPSTIGKPSRETSQVAARVAAEKRFFHWELEFPDVFRKPGSGFDAIVGNPPWDIAKPNSKEFFSERDPLYQAQANPEARQREMFAHKDVEQSWLDYNARFVAWANYVKYAALPFGDPRDSADSKDRFRVAHGAVNESLHMRWRDVRSKTASFASRDHSYRHQGGADLNLYKLFAERMYSLLSTHGHLGVVLPAAIYSDSGATSLRQLLVHESELRWLFGFENRNALFPIDSRYRFCCLITKRGGATRMAMVAFGQRDFAAWESAEMSAFSVSLADLHLFSPLSRSVPEVDSAEDVTVLRRLFSTGKLMGEEATAPWGTRYSRELDMTGARRAGLFVPADRVSAVAAAEAPGHWGSGENSYVAMYTGKMIAPFDFAYQRWLSGHGNHAKWQEMPFGAKRWEPEFVTPVLRAPHVWRGGTRLAFRDFARSTDERTMMSAVIPAWPCGNKVPILADEGEVAISRQLALSCILNSFAYDFVVRTRITGMNLNKFIVIETPVPVPTMVPVELVLIGARLSLCHEVFAPAWEALRADIPGLQECPWRAWWATDPGTRLGLRAAGEALIAHLYGLTEPEFRWILRECDHPREVLSSRGFRSQLPPKGLWRVGIGSAEHPWRRAWDCDPELRLTNLALVAYADLARVMRNAGGDLRVAAGSFAPVGLVEGWTLPEDLRLQDYGLGRDVRAEKPQIVRRLFPDSAGMTSAAGQGSWNECIQVAETMRTLWTQWRGAGEPRKSTKARSDRRTSGPEPEVQGSFWEPEE